MGQKTKGQPNLAPTTKYTRAEVRKVLCTTNEVPAPIFFDNSSGRDTRKWKLFNRKAGRNSHYEPIVRQAN